MISSCWVDNTKIMVEQQQQTVFGTCVNIQIDPDSFPSEADIQQLEDQLPPCEHGWFDSCHKNAKLHYRSWVPSSMKGVAVFFHGIMSHSGQGLVLDGQELGTTLLSNSFLKEGIALYAFDAYGHGFSEGERFYIPGWENNFKDCLTFCQLVSEKHDQVPLFVTGES